MFARILWLLCATKTQKQATWTSEKDIQCRKGCFSGRHRCCWIGKELNFYNHFLVDSELEKGRHCALNFANSSFNNSFLNEELDHVFNQLESTAKVNLAFGFVVKNIENGTCRYFSAHEINTVIEMSKLVCNHDDMVNLKEKMQEIETVDHCTRERAITKLRFYELTNVTIFASSLKNVPMDCEDTVLPEPLLNNNNVKCLLFEKTTKQPYIDNLFFFALLLYICRVNTSCKRRLQKFSLFAFFFARKEMPQFFKNFTWTKFQKTCCSSKLLYLILISLTEPWLVNLLVEVFKNLTKFQSFTLH